MAAAVSLNSTDCVIDQDMDDIPVSPRNIGGEQRMATLRVRVLKEPRGSAAGGEKTCSICGSFPFNEWLIVTDVTPYVEELRGLDHVLIPSSDSKSIHLKHSEKETLREKWKTGGGKP